MHVMIKIEIPGLLFNHTFSSYPDCCLVPVEQLDGICVCVYMCVCVCERCVLTIQSALIAGLYARLKGQCFAVVLPS